MGISYIHLGIPDHHMGMRLEQRYDISELPLMQRRGRTKATLQRLGDYSLKTKSGEDSRNQITRLLIGKKENIIQIGKR